MSRGPRNTTRLAWALGLCAAFSTISVRADEQRSRAREHFDRAVTLLEQKKFPEALKELEEAYTLHPHPSVLYNIGMTHHAMGSSVAAAKNLERYLSEAGSAVPPERRVETLRVLDELATRLATLVLDVEPKGASVLLNGSAVGVAGPITVVAGRQELVVSHAGHRTERRSLDLKGRTTTSLQIRLEMEATVSRARAPLEIDCAVPDATVYVDDAAVARTPVSSVLIAPGPHRVEFRRAGYVPSKHAVLATPGVSSWARCQLTPSSSGQKGRIALGGPAAAGRAWVDEKELPADGRVPPGRHHVKIVAAGHWPWEGDVVISAGKTLTLGTNLAPTNETLRDRATQRTWAWALGAHGLGLMLVAGGVYYWNSDRFASWEERQRQMDREWLDSPYHDKDLAQRQTQNDDLRESIRQFDAVSAGLGIGGALLLGTGAVLYFTGESPSEGSVPVVTATPNGIRGQWTTRF